MTNPINGSPAKQNFRTSYDTHSSLDIDLAGVKEPPVPRHVDHHPVYQDDNQSEWGRKKKSLLFNIQCCQFTFAGVLIFMLATLSLSIPIALFALYLIGMYGLLIRETHRARLDADDRQHLGKTLSMSWSVFFRDARRTPMILFPSWNSYK